MTSEPGGSFAADDPAETTSNPTDVPIACSNVGTGTLTRFLCGRSDAIWSVARAKNGWILGGVFVLSAGLAREYDRSDLLAEPYHLLIPFVASLATSMLLYAFVRAVARFRVTEYQPSLREFLQCYWATAPLAWLYAIPVEHMYDAAGAVHANFALLAIIAMWRVVLMIRTVRTLWGADVVSAPFIVLVYGDFILICALYFSPVPVLDLMAGNRLSPAERALQSNYILVWSLAWGSSPIWLIGLVVTFFDTSEIWRPFRRPVDPSPNVAGSARCLAAGAVVIGGVLCWIEQPKQQNATMINGLVDCERYRDAIERLTKLRRADFPPHWELPPHIDYPTANRKSRQLSRFYLAAVETAAGPDWVRVELQRKVIRSLPFFATQMTEQLSADELESLVRAIEVADESGAEFAALHFFDGEKSEDEDRAALLKRLEAVYNKHRH